MYAVTLVTLMIINTVVGALDTQVVSYSINNFIRKFVGGVEFKYMF